MDTDMPEVEPDKDRRFAAVAREPKRKRRKSITRSFGLSAEDPRAERICWVCMRGFRSDAHICLHNASVGHLELVKMQALNMEPRQEGRRRDALRKKLLQLDVEEDRYNHPNPDVGFCVCLLDWIIGPCRNGCKAGPNVRVSELDYRLNLALAEAQRDLEDRETRSKLLRKPLRAALHESIEGEIEVEAREYKDVPMIERIRNFASHQLSRIQESPESRIARSPLIRSDERKQTLTGKMEIMARRRMSTLLSSRGNEVGLPQIGVQRPSTNYLGSGGAMHVPKLL